MMKWEMMDVANLGGRQKGRQILGSDFKVELI